MLGRKKNRKKKGKNGKKKITFISFRKFIDVLHSAVN